MMKSSLLTLGIVLILVVAGCKKRQYEHQYISYYRRTGF